MEGGRSTRGASDGDKFKVLGQEYPDTLNSMGILASTFWNQGRWKEAEELDVQMIKINLRCWARSIQTRKN
jgi:hypothetical protein